MKNQVYFNRMILFGILIFGALPISALGYGSFTDTTGQNYSFWGNDGQGNGFEGSTIEETLSEDDDDYVWVRDKYGKTDELGISADDFLIPPSTQSYSVPVFHFNPFYITWVTKHFYRSSIDEIKIAGHVKPDMWTGDLNCENLRVRFATHNGLYSSWRIIDAVPNARFEYEFSKTYDYNGEPAIFNAIRAGNDFVDHIQVELEDTDDCPYLVYLYLNIDCASVTYYDN